MEDKSKKIVVVITGIWTLAFVLGVWGYYLLDTGNAETLSDYIYHALQLFTLAGSWQDGIPIPWQHEVARFLAPFVTVFALVFAILSGLHSQIQNRLALYWYKDHVIVCGVGTKGSIIIQSLLAEGYRVIAIELNADNANIAVCREKGVCVIIGSALNVDTLKKSGLAKAKAFITVCDTPAKNIEIELLLRGLPLAPALTRYIHTTDSTLSGRLERYERLSDTKDSDDLRFFNIFESSARILFNRYPPEVYADLFDAVRPHLVIFGFSDMGQHIALEAIGRCHYINRQRLKITIIDPQLTKYKNHFFRRYPQIQQVCDFNFIEDQFGLYAAIPLNERLINLGAADIPTSYIVCVEDSALGLSDSLYLHEISQTIDDSNTPIFVYMPTHSGFLKLLESNKGKPEILDNLFAFCQLEDVLSVKHLMNEELDELGKSLHEGYLEQCKINPEKDIEENPAKVDWVSLPSRYKKGNRQAGDHVDSKLRALRAHISDSPNRDEFEYDEDKLDILAETEHRRWMASKYLDGWQYGKPRNDAARRHPDLVPWDELSEGTKGYDRGQISKDIPQAIKLSGKSIARDFYLGVIADAVNLADKLDEIGVLLESIKASYPHRNYFVMCSLANPAEQQVVEQVMKRWGAKLIIPLPLPYPLYQDDLKKHGIDDSEKNRIDESFRRLAGESERYYEMPLRFGTIQTLLPNTPLRDQQYAFAKAHIIERSDDLLLIKRHQGHNHSSRISDVMAWLDNGVIPEDYGKRMQYFFKDNKMPVKHIFEAE
ncbi:MAG: NAD-binding protein [Methylococcaceae bacterium]